MGCCKSPINTRLLFILLELLGPAASDCSFFKKCPSQERTLGAMVIILGPSVRAFPMEITHILCEKAHQSRSNVKVCDSSAARANHTPNKHQGDVECVL